MIPRRSTLGLLLVMALHVPIFEAAQGQDRVPRANWIDLLSVLRAQDVTGFARVNRPWSFRFPIDHGPHSRFLSEWWYFTGNLNTAEGRRFGYELTFFRIALRPGESGRKSRWAYNQFYMAHFALTDVAAGRFHHFERLARNALGLAGARAYPFRVWLEDWSVGQPDPADADRWRLQATAGNVALDLALVPEKPPVAQGDKGLSKKGGAKGEGSYYYSITRIGTRGTVALGDSRHEVTGLSWMDREWNSPSPPGKEMVGWDWFALHLDDGWDLMFYQLRRGDGSRDPDSAGSLVDPAGRVIRLRNEEVFIDVQDSWESPRGGRYPSGWHLHVVPMGLHLQIEPVLENQELITTVRYWEGAVDVVGTRGDKEISGEGYVELTGYGLERGAKR